MTALLKIGISACHISQEQNDTAVKEGVIQGQFQLVYFTPEILLTNKTWRKVLSSDVYAKRLRGFVVDEAHTIVKW